MKSDVPGFEVLAPATLTEALAQLARVPGEFRPIAGGTDLMVMLTAGKLSHRRYVSLWGLRELRGIEESSSHVTLGALTTYTDIGNHPTLNREFPMLCQASRETGGVAIQNRGTLGGNIANASPAADSSPALLAYAADVELTSATGSRWVAYDSFHTGYRRTLLAADEIVSRIRLPRVFSARVHYYFKVGPRRAQAISKICFAGCAEVENGRARAVRIAIGGVAPIVPRCRAAEKVLEIDGVDAMAVVRAKEALAAEIAPIDDVRSTARYRQAVATNLLVDFMMRVRANVGLGS